MCLPPPATNPEPRSEQKERAGESPLLCYRLEMNSSARSYHPGIVEAMLWVLSHWSISSQEGSGSAVFIPRIISSITSGWMTWK